MPFIYYVECDTCGKQPDIFNNYTYYRLGHLKNKLAMMGWKRKDITKKGNPYIDYYITCDVCKEND